MKRLITLFSALALLGVCQNRWKALEAGFQTPPDSIRTADDDLQSSGMLGPVVIRFK